MIFSNAKVYNGLKQVALIWLPGIAALYVALAGLWGLPDVKEVVGTISAVDTFLGALLHISSNSYKSVNDGKLVVDKSDPEKDVYRLEMDTPLDQIDKKDSVKLAVKAS